MPRQVLAGLVVGAVLGGAVSKRQLPHAGLGIGGLWPVGALAGAFLGAMVGSYFAE